MKEEIVSPRLRLESEYLLRRKNNANYSLRAFSRMLKLPSGRVSQLLSEKRAFTKKLGEKIAIQLNYDPKQTHQFLEGIESARKNKSTVEPTKTTASYRVLEMDLFQSIADPMHFALLSLVETDHFKGDTRSIAKSLSISNIEARSAVDRLIRIGLLRRNKEKHLELVHSPGLTTSNDIQSAALKSSHKKVLAEALTAIDEIALEWRDITSITMAIDPKKIPAAKEMMKKFRRNVSALMESGQRSEVYRLNMQLVPVTGKEEKR